MTTIVYHESYGDVTEEQLKLYKSKNISPLDHDILTDRFGEDTPALIKFVKERSGSGSFRWTGEDF